MELAISPLLRAFIAKDRAGGCDLERCELLPTLSEISPRDPRRELRPQGQAVAAPIGKGVHFLRNNVSRFAQRAGKDCRILKHRYFYPRDAVQPPYPINSHHPITDARLLFAHHVLTAAHVASCLSSVHEAPS